MHCVAVAATFGQQRVQGCIADAATFVL